MMWGKRDQSGAMDIHIHLIADRDGNVYCPDGQRLPQPPFFVT